MNFFKEYEHYSIEFENAIIGSAIMFPECANNIIQLINTRDVFYIEYNKNLYEVISDMSDKGLPIDVITVTQEMYSRKYSNVDKWSYYITKVCNNVVGYEYNNLEYWCRIIIQFYIKRLLHTFQMDVGKYDDPMIAYSEIQKKIQEVTDLKKASDWKDSNMLMQSLQDRRKKIELGQVYGVNTGYKRMDEITGGFQTGLHIIAARPGMGKSAFALSLMLNMLDYGYICGLISLEMPDNQLAARIVSGVSGIPFKNIFRLEHSTDTEKIDVEEKIEEFKLKKIYYTDSSSMTPLDVFSKCRKLVYEKKANIIFIDYLQLIDIKSEKGRLRHELVGELSRRLKILSKELDIPIVALAQLNRESETADKASKMGKVSQLRESGSLEQDMDMGIIIDREYKRGILFDDAGQSTINNATISIQKHRNGEESDIPIRFNNKSMRFEDIQVSNTFDQHPFELENTKVVRTSDVPSKLGLPF